MKGKNKQVSGYMKVEEIKRDREEKMYFRGSQQFKNLEQISKDQEVMSQ